MNPADESKDNSHPSSPPREPDLDREESVPTDGKDIEGEELMKDVRNDQLKDPPPKK